MKDKENNFKNWANSTSQFLTYQKYRFNITEQFKISFKNPSNDRWGKDSIRFSKEMV